MSIGPKPKDLLVCIYALLVVRQPAVVHDEVGTKEGLPLIRK